MISQIRLYAALPFGYLALFLTVVIGGWTVNALMWVAMFIGGDEKPTWGPPRVQGTRRPRVFRRGGLFR